MAQLLDAQVVAAVHADLIDGAVGPPLVLLAFMALSSLRAKRLTLGVYDRRSAGRR
ncbi:MAG: hypothetical protein ACJ8LN_14665 [Sulfurifustis sp.]